MGLQNMSSNKFFTKKPSAIHVRPKDEWHVYQLIAQRQPSETYSRPYNDWLLVTKSGNAQPQMPEGSFPTVYTQKLYLSMVQTNG